MSWPDWAANSKSAANGQRSLGPGSVLFDLYPPQLEGAGPTDFPGPYPLEVTFDYSMLTASYFLRPVTCGLDQWQEILPPLAPGLSLGEGGTPLVDTARLSAWAGTQVQIKDESRNPTWSHKDRLNLCTVSSALASGSPGIVVASSGNHGASAAAYAARAGLSCILITSHGTATSAQGFMRAYGSAAVAVPVEARRELLAEVARRTGFMPVSSLTERHVGNPFGPEGYKTIAYELYSQLGNNAPSAVFAPTGYAELLFGLLKGFSELKSVGLIEDVPGIFACEPAARAPLTKAMRERAVIAEVAANPTEAIAIACTISSYRGYLSVTGSQGLAIGVTDDEIRDAQCTAARAGMWPEYSAASALAGIRKAVQSGIAFHGPVVAIQTSCGFKDPAGTQSRIPEIEPTFAALRSMVKNEYGLAI